MSINTNYLITISIYVQFQLLNRLKYNTFIIILCCFLLAKHTVLCGVRVTLQYVLCGDLDKNTNGIDRGDWYRTIENEILRRDNDTSMLKLLTSFLGFIFGLKRFLRGTFRSVNIILLDFFLYSSARLSNFFKNIGILKSFSFSQNQCVNGVSCEWRYIYILVL